MKDLEMNESSDSENVEEIQCIKNDELKKTNVTHVVLGDLLAGTSYSTSQIILAANGNKPVSRAAYFKKQSEIIPKVEMHGQQSVRRALNRSIMRGSRIFSYDSRWSSQYHGKENTCSLFDVETGELVALNNTIKTRDIYGFTI